MTPFLLLTKRHIKLFFKDKGMFFTSLITPAILLVLYGFFLKDIYHNNLTAAMPEPLTLSSSLIDGLVAGQLISSILAVSCVTVAFCSNFLMVQDKANGTIRDLTITPVKPATLSMSYYLASFLSTLLICLVATALCLLYTYMTGWYLSGADVALLLLDVVLLVLFGTALSSLINFFLSTQGQISAVGTIVSAGYGFICGAYMPISFFGGGLQKVLSLLPGTYATSLVRSHAMRGALTAMQNEGLPTELIEGLRDSLDCNLYWGGSLVTDGAKYVIISAAILLLVIAYIAVYTAKRRLRR